MTKFDLLSWGANSHYQLGQGTESEQCTIPLAVNLNGSDLSVPEITKVTGGAGHTLILNKKGEVYSCGLNEKGQAGVSCTKKYVKGFVKLETFKNDIIVDIACGWDSSMAINNLGDLYVWGSNAYGQLGILTSGKKNILYEPYKINLEKNGLKNTIKKIAMGLRHSVLVNKNDEIYVAGNGNKCQLGLIDSSNIPTKKSHTFVQVPQLRGIKSVSCGQHHTVALTKNGEIYAWGDNKHGQIGFDVNKHPIVESPLKLDIDVGLYGEIFTGWTHTAVLHDGKVLAWGRNTYGQLGCGEKFEKTWIPELVKNVPKFVQLALGSEHNIALTEDGSMMCWGWNEHGNCGTGSVKDVRLPERIKVPKNRKAKLIGTGYGHSFAVFEK